MELKELPDEDLIILSKEGNISALGILIERYQSAIFNFILRMISSRGGRGDMGGRQEAEDLLQETFLKVIKNLPGFQLRNFKSYLYTIANNTVIDYLRRSSFEAKTMVSLEQTLHQVAQDDCYNVGTVLADHQERTPEEVFYQQELKHKIQEAIATLPYEQKQVFVLHEYSGLTFKEIAELTNCSINTVLSRFQYALKKLKSELKPDRSEHSRIKL